MIQARDFVEAARQRGFHWYAGVPCSFLTPFINYVLQDATLSYVSMANEGDAVALIAGVALAETRGVTRRRGVTMMQNSGLGNAVSPLTSLTWTFRLPQLLIITWRGQPGIVDEPQHDLMGPITPTMLETMDIPFEIFPTEVGAIGPALDRATKYMDAHSRPYALVMQKGSVASYPLRADLGDANDGGAVGATTAVQSVSRNLAAAARPSRRDALRHVVANTATTATAVMATTGFCGRELFAVEDRPNHFYMVGSMGCVVPLALGFALARPELRVLAIDGDGAALMRLSAFATVGAYRPSNLWHLLLDNGVHDSTGGQSTVSPQISFAGIAADCGYAAALETDDLDRVGQWLTGSPLQGPQFARLLIRAGAPADLPRPSVSPAQVKDRFMRHFAAGPIA